LGPHGSKNMEAIHEEGWKKGSLGKAHCRRSMKESKGLKVASRSAREKGFKKGEIVMGREDKQKTKRKSEDRYLAVGVRQLKENRPLQRHSWKNGLW